MGFFDDALAPQGATTPVATSPDTVILPIDASVVLDTSSDTIDDTVMFHEEPLVEFASVIEANKVAPQEEELVVFAQETVVTDVPVANAPSEVVKDDTISSALSVLKQQADDMGAPEAILMGTIAQLKRSEESLEERAQSFEKEATQYHKQAEDATQAEQDAIKQAAIMHEQAEKLESTIQAIDDQRKNFIV